MGIGNGSDGKVFLLLLLFDTAKCNGLPSEPSGF